MNGKLVDTVVEVKEEGMVVWTERSQKIDAWGPRQERTGGRANRQPGRGWTPTLTL